MQSYLLTGTQVKEYLMVLLLFFFFFQYSLALSYMEQILPTILKLLVKLELIGISMGVGTP